jgi:hypothetical protein
MDNTAVSNAISTIFTVLCCLGAPLVITTAILVFLVLRDPRLVNGDVPRAGKALAIGLALWVFALALVGVGMAVDAAGARATLGGAGIVLMLVLWIVSCVGWENYPYRGGAAFQLKMIITLFLGATVFGLVLLAYWTGCAVLRLLNQ